jgi:integrase
MGPQVRLSTKGVFLVFIQTTSLDDAIARLEPPRSTLFRWFRTGKASYIQTADGFEFTLPPYKRKAPKSPHRKFIKPLLEWRSSSLGVKPWSITYQKKQKEYLEKYFKRFPLISSESLRSWLEETDPHRLTLRRLKHAAVSGLARYLYEAQGLISFDEYTKIRMLYPRKPPNFRRKVKYVYEEDLQAILNVATGVDRSLIIFLAETALRVSEALMLEVGDVVFLMTLEKPLSLFGRMWAKVARLVLFHSPELHKRLLDNFVRAIEAAYSHIQL